ncbi:hypothetical protein EBU58_08670, partial [bacterium]|nr:hypothetical protein [bacterium]
MEETMLLGTQESDVQPFRFYERWLVVGTLSSLLLVAVAGGRAVGNEARPATVQDDAAVIDRLREDVTWLAAPEREGRGPGTAGITAAADWIAEQFTAAGLQQVGPLRRQSFVMTLEATLPDDKPNRAELVGPPGESGTPTVIPLELGKTFTPLAAGGSGPFDLPLVFAGYGITAPAEDYDDYLPLGAATKAAAAVVLRQEPQKENPHSVFNGNQASQHAALVRKIANAS